MGFWVLLLLSLVNLAGSFHIVIHNLASEQLYVVVCLLLLSMTIVAMLPTMRFQLTIATCLLSEVLALDACRHNQF